MKSFPGFPFKFVQKVIGILILLAAAPPVLAPAAPVLVPEVPVLVVFPLDEVPEVGVVACSNLDLEDKQKDKYKQSKNARILFIVKKINFTFYI
jgi:hypothetical protein